MNTFTAASAFLLAAASATPSLAQTAPTSRELGTVISVTPIVQQVAVPRQACYDETVNVQQQPAGGGALFGAIVGGALGNSVGAGAGRAAATAFGALSGAAIGNSLEANAQPHQAQTVRRCTTETVYEDRTGSYNVVYEYGGRQYSTVMRRDPGRTVQVQVQAVGDGDSAPPQYAPPPRPRSSAPPTSSRLPPPVYADRGDYPRYADRGDYPRYAEPAYVPAPPPAPVYYYDYGPQPQPYSYAAPFGAGVVVGALIGYGARHGYRDHRWRGYRGR